MAALLGVPLVMATRPWSQMTPSEHLDAAEAVTTTALNVRGSVTRRQALLDVAALHAKAAEVQALLLVKRERPAPASAGEREAVMELERQALVQRMADDMAAVRTDVARVNRLL